MLLLPPDWTPAHYTLYDIISLLSSIDCFRVGGEGAINELKQDTKDILNFLNHDKQAKMEANFETLKSIYDLLPTIKKDEKLAEIKMGQLGAIQKEFAQDIKFYKKQTKAALSDYVSAHRKKKNEIRLLGKVKDNLNYQKWCIIAYSLSRFLEIAITENYTKTYIESIKTELVNNQQLFEEQYDAIAPKVYKHIKSKPSNVLKSEAAEALLCASVIAEMTPLKRLNVDDAIENASDSLNADVHKRSRKIADEMKYDAEDKINGTFIERLDLINAVYNKPLEILCAGEDYYLKCDNNK